MSKIIREKIVGMTDELTSLGLRLAGIGNVIALKPDDTGSKQLSKIANDETVAVLIITESYAEKNRDVLNRLSRRPWPVIVEIPGPEGKIERESSTLKELVKNALGIEIDL
jgi:vacuolar-type H+-ATPase subunit F/Vma7